MEGKAKNKLVHYGILLLIYGTGVGTLFMHSIFHGDHVQHVQNVRYSIGAHVHENSPLHELINQSTKALHYVQNE